MDAQTFLDNFGTIAEAPGGVQRLRDLVLDLALSGQLSQREGGDDSVSALLKETRQQLDAAARNGEIQRSTSAKPVTDPPHLIPSTWDWQPLSNLVAILDFRRKPVKQEERLARVQGKAPTELFPYFGATQQAGVIDDYLFDEELVLLGEDGAPFLTEGKHVAYLATGKYWVNNHAHVLRGMAVRNAYLVHALNRVDFADFVTGTTRLKLTQGKLVNVPIPVPPLAEQDRVVAIIGELATLCDALEARQERHHHATTRFRGSALDALAGAESPDDLHCAWERVSTKWAVLTATPVSVTGLRELVVQLATAGRLVRQNANDEPAASLLSSCRARKADLVKSGAVRSRPPLDDLSADDLSSPLPPGWALARLDDWCDVSGGVAKGRKLSGRATATVPYMRVANVKAGYLALDEVKEIEIPLDEVDRYSLAPGDVLLTEGGDWDKLGRSAIWTGEIAPCLHQNHVFRARTLDPGLLPEWVSLFTNSAAGRAYFQSKAKRTTNLASINMTELRSLPLPVPPAAEQHRILAAYGELLRACDELELRLIAQDDRASRLAAGLTQVA